MSQHFYHALTAWFPHRDDHNWLLATVIDTKGSAYRRPGAMVLFNDAGGQFGIVSGGCLESDLLHQARKCWLRQSSATVTYDMREEGDIAWRLGIGCGGEITLLLQPVSASNQYLHLDSVLEELRANRKVNVGLNTDTSVAQTSVNADEARIGWHYFTLTPPARLLILGGGTDAQPVAEIAHTLGWHVTVNDPRARHARHQDFPSAFCSGEPYHRVEATPWFTQAQVIVVMHHHVELDAKALGRIASTPPEQLNYLALLGPSHRAQRVLTRANLAEGSFSVPLQSPAGLALGGELPESIALSILAHAHSVLHNADAQPLRGKPCHTD